MTEPSCLNREPAAGILVLESWSGCWWGVRFWEPDPIASHLKHNSLSQPGIEDLAVGAKQAINQVKTIFLIEDKGAVEEEQLAQRNSPRQAWPWTRKMRGECTWIPGAWALLLPG